MSAHDRQVPVQAVEQHTPCEQLPELQAAFAVHVAPVGSRPQAPPMHVAGETQSASAMQVFLHTPAVMSHANGLQSDGVTVWQVPAPSHVRAGVNVEVTQVEAAHWVPLAYLRQAPEPSHWPSVPQLVAPWSLHWPSGSCPFGTLVQVPAVAVSAHDMQVPVQVDAQHTPCWQLPDAHSVPAVHMRPSGFFVQTPALQTFGATQSVSTVQLTLHTLLAVSHWKAPQEVGAATTQVPAPSQAKGAVNVDPVQLPARHCVPAT
jgi:hypothetical protein